MVCSSAVCFSASCKAHYHNGFILSVISRSYFNLICFQNLALVCFVKIVILHLFTPEEYFDPWHILFQDTKGITCVACDFDVISKRLLMSSRKTQDPQMVVCWVVGEALQSSIRPEG